MDAFLISIKTVLPLFLIILTGLAFSRSKAANENWVEILNKYAYWIGFPALVIFSLMKLDLSGNTYSTFIILNSVFILVSMILVFPLARIFNWSVNLKRSMFIIIPFGNVTYLGIPILQNAFGDEILPEAAIVSAVYVFWLLTLAILLIEIYGEEKVNIKKLGLRLFKNPLLISVFIGLIIVFFQIPIPEFAEKTMKLFADSVTAVVLFSLGIFLGKQKLGKLKDWIFVAGITLLTMIVLPYIFYQVVKPFSLQNANLDIIILEAAMPLGVTPYVLSVQYKLKTELITRIVVFGTLISVFIIPLWMVILGG